MRFEARDPERIDKIIGLLRVAWYANPDWRLGQLTVNASRDDWGSTTGYNPNDLFYIEDDQMEVKLRKLIADADTRS